MDEWEERGQNICKLIGIFLQWSGTFPVGKICAENVAKRLDSLLGSSTNGITQQQQQKGRLAGTHSILAISPNEIIATAVDNPKVGFG